MVTPEAFPRISIDNAALMPMPFKWFIAVVSALLLTGLARSTAQGQTLLMGGGATFPHPIYARWIAEYQNIPGVAAELKFTPEALAGIFLGKITKWDDPRLTKTNLEAKLYVASCPGKIR
jgi:ABC-type phosphate transport system substrate-binding protein